MSLKTHLFYLGAIALLLLALLFQGRQLQRLSGASGQGIASEAAYAALRKAPRNYQVIDLRGAEEYEEGHLPGALHLAGGALQDGLRLDRFKTTLIITNNGDPQAFRAGAQRLGLAAARNLDGGMRNWRRCRLPEESGSGAPAGGTRGPAGCL